MEDTTWYKFQPRNTKELEEQLLSLEHQYDLVNEKIAQLEWQIRQNETTKD